MRAPTAIENGTLVPWIGLRRLNAVQRLRNLLAEKNAGAGVGFGDLAV